MGLETGTWINDLVTTNPLGTDLKTQGDDHLRLLKTILKNTFPRAGKAFYFPQNLSKAANYTVVAADDKSVISVDTTAGAVTLTLPTLGAGDDGWSIDVLKTNTGANPVFIAPPAGTINGATKVRRTLEFLVTKVIWNGANFWASRPNGGCIGELRAFAGSTLPNDCLWPDGSTFVAANYVELNTALGGNTTPDVRGRVLAARDNLGIGAAGRIGTVATDNGTIVGSTLFSTGGQSTHTQAAGEVGAHGHPGSTANPHTHTVGPAPDTTSQSISPGGFGVPTSSTTTYTTSTASTTALTIATSAAPSAMSWLQPTIIVNMGLVAE